MPVIMPNKLTEQSNQWAKLRNFRAHTAGDDVRARTKRKTTIIAISYALLFAVFWSVYAIYVPVIKAEFSYVVQSLGEQKQGDEWWDWVVPDFEFALIPEVIASEWGLVIPKIYLQEKVVANINPASKQHYLPALDIGIAHAAGTELPGHGGLGYYFAHSSGMNVLSPHKEAVFYLLGKLVVGDEVIVYNYGKKYEYIVTKTTIVDASDVAFLTQDYDQETIVLQTCWPVGTSSKRLLVFAER